MNGGVVVRRRKDSADVNCGSSRIDPRVDNKCKQYRFLLRPLAHHVAVVRFIILAFRRKFSAAKVSIHLLIELYSSTLATFPGFLIVH
jgi:hypothetical protein